MALDSVAVIGAGAWGTALAQAAVLAGRQVTLYARKSAIVEEINARHTNERHLPDRTLDPGLIAAETFAPADIVILAVPAQMTRSLLESIDPDALAGLPVILTAKGLETGTLARQSTILADMAPDAIPYVLSGPSFAEDLAAGRPTAVTLAGDGASESSRLAAALASTCLRTYAADDRVGVEIAGALKNVYALACGAVEGAGLGASARAGLIARGYAEMARIVASMGGSASTLTGLAGLGDLTLSCTSIQSRNYRFGLGLGQGEARDDILASGAPLAEGVATAPVAAELAEKGGVDAPLIVAVNRLLDNEATISDIVTGLMTRPLKRET